MNALEPLKQDHQKVKKLLTAATGTEDKSEQKRLFREIRTELETHARILNRSLDFIFAWLAAVS